MFLRLDLLQKLCACSKEFLNHVFCCCCFIVFSRLFCLFVFLGVPQVLFGFSCLLKMFPLFVLDQRQLTWLTHEKTASLKTRKSALPGSPVLQRRRVRRARLPSKRRKSSLRTAMMLRRRSWQKATQPPKRKWMAPLSPRKVSREGLVVPEGLASRSNWPVVQHGFGNLVQCSVNRFPKPRMNYPSVLMSNVDFSWGTALQRVNSLCCTSAQTCESCGLLLSWQQLRIAKVWCRLVLPGAIEL